MTRRAYLLLGLLAALTGYAFAGPGGSGVRFWLRDSSHADAASGATATKTNTGPTYCWVDGELTEFADDVLRSGCEIPPGLTGGGDPARCDYHSHPSITNSILQSENLAATWSVDGGVGVVTCGHASTAFADARTVCKITDDNATAWEDAYQAVAHGLSNDDPVVLCVVAYADDAQTLDVQFREAAGACGGGATNYQVDSVALTTAPTIHCWAHTIHDATCTNIVPILNPHDVADGVAGVGHAYVTAVQVLLGTATIPSIYCPTTAAANTCGVDALSYAIANSAITTTANLAVAVADATQEGGDTSAWTTTNATLSKSAANPHDGTQALRITYASSANGSAYQTTTLTVGRKYRVQAWARGDGTANPRIGTGATGNKFTTGTNSTEWQLLDGTAVADHAYFVLGSAGMAVGTWVEYDSPTLTPITDITEELRGTVRVEMDVSVFVADIPATAVLWHLDNGIAAQRASGYFSDAERLLWVTTPGGTDMTSAPQVLAAGASYRFEWRSNYDLDAHEERIGGASVGTSAVARSSPVGITTFRIGMNTTAGQPPGGACFSNIRVSR